ncbi:GNAT family N-acetyltransferase [Butyrivibrio fibrisolvens]|nr:GNAT family N-acetyltransferase [Butyrivibrio fibrisolvens]
MRIINYFDSDRKDYWLGEIQKCDWEAARFLYDMLSNETFFDFVGEGSKVLLLTDGDELISFCTYAKKDDIPATDLTPWMGFVFTRPEHRGHHYVALLMEEVEKLAREEGISEVYISTSHVGLYEKYGCELKTKLKDMNGELSRVYVKKVGTTEAIG